MKKKSLFEKKTISDYFAIITIFVAAIAPYILVETSTDLFYFSGYEGRHAYLLSLSFGLFFTIILKEINYLYNAKKIHLLISVVGKKSIKFYTNFFF